MPKRVLVADDSESVRRAIQRVLAHSGVNVCATASNGTEALDTALLVRPDVVVLDLRMPGLNGIEVAALLKKHLPLAKVVLFTMYAEAVSQTTASVIGVPVVSKAGGLGALVQTVKNFLSDTESVVPESGAA